MIRQLIVGIARALFGASILVFMFGAGLAYLSYRVIRFAIRGDKPYPTRDASFQLLLAGAVLAKAMQAEGKRRGRPVADPFPGPPDPDLIYLEDDPA